MYNICDMDNSLNMKCANIFYLYLPQGITHFLAEAIEHVPAPIGKHTLLSISLFPQLYSICGESSCIRWLLLFVNRTLFL